MLEEKILYCRVYCSCLIKDELNKLKHLVPSLFNHKQHNIIEFNWTKFFI